MEFRVLGPLDVTHGGRSLPLGGAQQRKLLAILLTHANEVIAADRIAQLLWEDSPPATAGHSLVVYVSNLRRVLEPGGGPYTMLETRGSGYVLQLVANQFDAWRFEHLVQSAKNLTPAERAHALANALALWRGRAYAEFASMSFALAEASRLEELRLHALEERIEADLHEGRHEALIGELEALVMEHPQRERLSGQLMLALYRSGRQAEASTVYQETRSRLVDEVGMEPGPQLQSLLARILKQDPSLAPISHPGERSGLPVQLASFVGRSSELEELRAVAHRSRLVTLIGPGGVGKTRLAVEVARTLRDRGTVGSAWFVDLAPLRSGDLLEQTVITALGGGRDAAARSIETIAALLGPAQSLLVLDNCEHLIDSVARLVDQLLRRHPSVSIIATSREPLRIASEARWLVSPLKEEDGVLLFVERAQLIDRKFGPAEQPESAVRTLCRELDFLPLAIELAAARVGQMPVSEMLLRLDDRFALFTESDRLAPARHHSLEAALDWSHELLSPEERVAFAFLSAFAGSFDARAAEEVAGCSVDQIGRLVEKSMVVVAETGVEGRVRYRLLETLRQYAFQRLKEGGWATEAARRHFRHFADLSRKAGPELNGQRMLHWLHRIAEDMANVRSALEWGLAEEPNSALTMAVDLQWFWNHGQFAEGRWWLRRLISAAQGAPTADRAAAMRIAADIGDHIGERDSAEVELARALNLWREVGDPAGISRTLVNIARMAPRTAAEIADQQPNLHEALIEARRAGDDFLIMEANSYLGLSQAYAGKFEEGRAHQLEAEAIARRCFGLTSVAWIVWRDAIAYIWEGDLANARARCEAGMAMYADAYPSVQGFSFAPALPFPHVLLGWMGLAENDAGSARHHFEASMGVGVGPNPSAVEGIAILAGRSGHFVRVLKLAGAASARYWGGGWPVLPGNELEAWIERARFKLDPTVADAAWRVGAAMSMSEVTAYALSNADAEDRTLPLSRGVDGRM